MRLCLNPCARVEFLSFGEGTSNCCKGFQTFPFTDFVQIVYDGAIEISLDQVIIGVVSFFILRKLCASFFEGINQNFIGHPNNAQRGGFCEIETVTKINYGSNRERLSHSTFELWMPCHEARPLHSSL